MYFQICASRIVISLSARIQFWNFDWPPTLSSRIKAVCVKHYKGSPRQNIYLAMLIRLMFLMYFSLSDSSADLAPVASSLCVQYTHRTVVITGGLLAFSGMALGFFGLNMVWMYATTGFLQGMNLCLYGFLPPATYLRVLVVGVLKSGIYFDFMSSQNEQCSLKVISLTSHSGNKHLYRKSAATKKTNI